MLISRYRRKQSYKGPRRKYWRIREYVFQIHTTDNIFYQIAIEMLWDYSNETAVEIAEARKTFDYQSKKNISFPFLNNKKTSIISSVICQNSLFIDLKNRPGVFSAKDLLDWGWERRKKKK